MKCSNGHRMAKAWHEQVRMFDSGGSKATTLSRCDGCEDPRNCRQGEDNIILILENEYECNSHRAEARAPWLQFQLRFMINGSGNAAALGEKHFRRYAKVPDRIGTCT